MDHRIFNVASGGDQLKAWSPPIGVRWLEKQRKCIRLVSGLKKNENFRPFFSSLETFRCRLLYCIRFHNKTRALRELTTPQLLATTPTSSSTQQVSLLPPFPSFVMHSSPMANQNALLAYENPAHLTTAYTVTTTTTTHTQTQAAYTLPYDLSSTGNAELWGTETLRSSGSASARQPAEMIVDAVRIPEEFGVGGESDGLLSCGLLPEAVPNILLDLEFPCPFRYLTEKDMGPEQKPWTRLSWAELPQHPTQGPPKQVIGRRILLPHPPYQQHP